MTNKFEFTKYDKDFAKEIQGLRLADVTSHYIEDIENALSTYPQDVQDAVKQLFKEENENIAVMNGVFKAVKNDEVKRTQYGFNTNSLKSVIKKVAKHNAINPEPYIRDAHNNYSIKISFGEYYFFSNEDENALNLAKMQISRKARLDVMNTMIKAQRNHFLENDDSAIKNRFIREFQRETGIIPSAALYNGTHIEGEQLEAVYQAVVEMRQQYDAMKKQAKALFQKYEGGTKWDF